MIRRPLLIRGIWALGAATIVGALLGIAFSQVTVTGPGATGLSAVTTAAGRTTSYGTVTVAAITTVRPLNNIRLIITVQNLSAVTVYCGPDAAVSTGNGLALGPTSGSGSTLTPGGSLTIDRYTGLVTCVSSSGNADVRYLEVSTP